MGRFYLNGRIPHTELQVIRRPRNIFQVQRRDDEMTCHRPVFAAENRNPVAALTSFGKCKELSIRPISDTFPVTFRDGRLRIKTSTCLDR